MAPLRNKGEHSRSKGNIVYRCLRKLISLIYNILYRNIYIYTNMNFILNVLEIAKYFALFYPCTNVFAIDQRYKIYATLLILIKLIFSLETIFIHFKKK